MKKLILTCLVTLLATGCYFEVDEPVTTTMIVDDPAIEEGDKYLEAITRTHGSFLELPDLLEEKSEAVEEEVAAYEVNNDTLAKRTIVTENDKFLSFANDKEKHEQLWNLFADLIPYEDRDMIKEFVIFTDGRDDLLGYVEPLSGENDEWRLGIDYEDTVNEKDFYYTLVHEYGHLLTLNNNQVIPADLSNEEKAEEAFLACDDYFAFNGCTKRDSYMNAFFETFWLEYYDEWLDSDVENDEEAQVAFFEENPDDFSTDYAATHPEEDIAEAWTHFIFSPKPDEVTIADKKVAFFYQYPELIQLRKEILYQLSESLDESE